MAVLDFIKNTIKNPFNPVKSTASLFDPKPDTAVNNLAKIQAGMSMAPKTTISKPATSTAASSLFPTPSKPNVTGSMTSTPAVLQPKPAAAVGGVSSGGPTTSTLAPKMAMASPLPSPAPSLPPMPGAFPKPQALPDTAPSVPTPSLPPPPAFMPAPTAPQAPAIDPMKANLEALRRSYTSTFDISPEERAAADQLSSISSQGSADVAKTQQEYADRMKAIQGQATLQPFLTGRQMQAQEQLGNQLAASKAAIESQTMPLEKKLAILQAQRLSQQERAKTELGFAQQDSQVEQPVEVGGRLVNPRTGQVVYEPPAGSQGPIELSAGSTLFDPVTGKPIYTAPRAESGSSDGDKILTPAEAQALGVPYGTTASEAYGRNVTGKPTEEQSKARQFAVAAENANKILEDVNYDPGLIEIARIPNALKGERRQQFEQASRALVNATLRRESGATIQDAEFLNKYKEIIPAAGDGPLVKKQKAAARAAAVQSIKEAGGNFQPEGGSGGGDWDF